MQGNTFRLGQLLALALVERAELFVGGLRRWLLLEQRLHSEPVLERDDLTPHIFGFVQLASARFFDQQLFVIEGPLHLLATGARVEPLTDRRRQLGNLGRCIRARPWRNDVVMARNEARARNAADPRRTRNGFPPFPERTVRITARAQRNEQEKLEMWIDA